MVYAIESQKVIVDKTNTIKSSNLFGFGFYNSPTKSRYNS